MTTKTKAKTSQAKQAWTVMCVPGDERTPGNWYAFNRDTWAQIRCENREEASRIVAELKQ